VIAYRFQTINAQTNHGVLTSAEEVTPAVFFTPQEAKEAVTHFAPHERVTIAKIQAIVSEYYEIAPEHMRSQSRARRHAYPRQMAMLLSRRFTPLSLPQIGKHFGGRDHSTIIHGIRRTKLRMQRNPTIEVQYEELLQRFSV
jgi:chromosomal replication initiation ATPase DnaA